MKETEKNNSNYLDREAHKDTEKMTKKYSTRKKDESKVKGTLQKQITPKENEMDDVK